MLRLPVFYYPTTVAWVDDDRLFLNAVSQALRTDYHVKTFNSPNNWLEFLEKYQNPTARNLHLRVCEEHEHYDTAAHSPVDFNAPSLFQLHTFLEKIDEISVLVVDYGMPGMNGIELCKKLRSLPIKKILLTGEAENHEAIAAFNDNTIDRFIRKDSPSLLADIQMHVTSLQQQYFCEQTQALLSHLEARQKIPSSDPIFAEFFAGWCKANNIREYYLIDKYGSIAAINKSGQVIQFIVHTDASLDTFVKLNDDVEDALDIIDDVKNRKKIPFFGIGREPWEIESKDWLPHFFAPNVLEGRDKYYWVVLNK